MTHNKWTYLPLLMVFFFTFACATVGDRPKFESVAHRDEAATLDNLKRNWTNYSISYAGGSVGLASAVIFDPKGDDRNLVGKDYKEVTDKKTLERVVSVIESYVTWTPRLYEIYGPHGDFFGFVFTAYYRPVPQKVDNKTLSLPNWKSQVYIGWY